MSNVTNAHDIKPYNSASSKALDGQRLSLILFKTPKDKKDDKSYTKPENRCVSIPILSITCVPAILASALQDAFFELQDAVIKSKIITADDAGTKKLVILDSEIDFESCAAYAAENAISGKLTKDVVENWFDANMVEKLTVAIANAMGLGDTQSADEIARLDASVEQHKKLFASCAATRPAINTKIAKSLLKALELSEEDKVQLALRAKLHKLANPSDPAFFGL